MKPKAKTSTLTTGFALFSMFFGAGNVVFPLAIGQYAKDMNIFSSTGLLVTAVGIPFLGVIAMTLFNGNTKHFFERIGKVPGFLVTLLLMGLIGPFGAMPRLIAVSHATASVYIPGISITLFSAFSALLIFLFTFKKAKIVDILGAYLTPVLLGSLGLIIVVGYFVSPAAPASDLSIGPAFYYGLEKGYEMMDLFAAFFFSSIILSCLESPSEKLEGKKDFQTIIFQAIKAGFIGCFLLAIVYIGFSSVASFNSSALEGLEGGRLLGELAVMMLGPYAASIAIIAVSLACLTTAIALAAVFSEFLLNEIFFGRVNYLTCLIGTLIVTFFMATLNFSGISSILKPILIVIYPAMIVLAICNILHKVWHINFVKTPVAITFLLSLFFYLY